MAVAKLTGKPTALWDNVILLLDEANEKTSGGIVLPETAQEKQAIGTVVDVGPGCFRDGVFVSTVLKPGQRVIFPRYEGTEILVDGKTCLVMHEGSTLVLLPATEPAKA